MATLQAPVADGDDVSDVDVPLGDDASSTSSAPHSNPRAKDFQSGIPDIKVPTDSNDHKRGEGEAETSTREAAGGGGGASSVATTNPSPSSTSIASSLAAEEAGPDAQHAIQELMNGATLQKYGRWGKAHLRHFTLSADKTRLCWESDKKKADKCVVVLSEVQEILMGRQTKVFKRFSKEKDRNEHLSFSLVYGPKGRTLDLQCRNKDQLVMWLRALRHLSGLRDPST